MANSHPLWKQKPASLSPDGMLLKYFHLFIYIPAFNRWLNGLFAKAFFSANGAVLCLWDYESN